MFGIYFDLKSKTDRDFNVRPANAPSTEENRWLYTYIGFKSLLFLPIFKVAKRLTQTISKWIYETGVFIYGNLTTVEIRSALKGRCSTAFQLKSDSRFSKQTISKKIN